MQWLGSASPTREQLSWDPEEGRKGARTCFQIVDTEVLAWDMPGVEDAAREKSRRGRKVRYRLYIIQDGQVTVKTFILTLRETGLVLGEVECHGESREEDIAAIQVRGTAGWVPVGGRHRSIGLWPFLKK